MLVLGQGRIILKDGLTIEGEVFGAMRNVAGEMVFNTSMVGYPEALTDPSYYGQILVFTYPMLGNYGVPQKERDEFGFPLGLESERIQVTAIVVQEAWSRVGHPLMKRKLGEWLAEEGVIGLSGVDTRFLTRHLRSYGTMLGKIVIEGDVDFYDPNASDVLSFVSSKEVRELGSGYPRILVVDCGVKLSIVRSLLKRGASVLLAP
ncbi:MAG: carbamoyl-phosphate synthase (glutamine-hydrolyzing) small subunit, partial [Planctomycetota bacterium]|nr:carbamoyl-phosphate synthase (glutamine-hydrolyzing) small subunit [Planctomycetota bacterium]